MCESCAEGYVKKGEVCVDPSARQSDHDVDISRYMTYFGLCVATCVIFNNNIYAASLIGVMVAAYIGIAEYTLDTRAPLVSPIEQAFRNLIISG